MEEEELPRELLRSVSLTQTLQLIRITVEVVEERVKDGDDMLRWGAMKVFATGTDPANAALTYQVLSREYANALVLYKPLSYAQGKGEGTTANNTATTHQLGGTYRVAPAAYRRAVTRLDAVLSEETSVLLARACVEAGAEVLLVPSCTDTLHGYWRVRIGAQGRALEGQCYAVHSPTVGEAAWSPAVVHRPGVPARRSWCPEPS